jgi:hypothetical protein
VAADFSLAIFHYHFLTGGVSSVVRQALAALRAHLSEIGTIRLVGGRMSEELRRSAAELQVDCRAVPEIDYRRIDRPDRKKTAALGRRLARRLLDSFAAEDTIWWVHNYHLGKNPIFTQALLHIIHSGRKQRVILQIHDFPECGRFQNLGLLRQSLSLDPYPTGPWVRYAVLTGRDRDILVSAGIRPEAVFVLENPLSSPASSGAAVAAGTPEPGAARSRLKTLFGRSFPRFAPDAPLLFYPIRTIRRKNALEALLICRLLGGGENLLITLPGVSDPEKAYSRRVARLFAAGYCPGLWGIGAHLERQGLGFGDLIAAADLVLSTSVQEGFGYLFLNSLQWRLPLAARDLDNLADIRSLFRGYRAYFYQQLNCPLGANESLELKEKYRRKIDSLSEFLSPASRERLLDEVNGLVSDGLVDFSYLPVERQEWMLREVAGGNPRLTGTLREANAGLLAWIADVLSSPTPAAGDKRPEIEARFGLKAYAEAFRVILDSFAPAAGGSGQNDRYEQQDGGKQGGLSRIQQGVLDRFLRLQHLRLLYDP